LSDSWDRRENSPIVIRAAGLATHDVYPTGNATSNTSSSAAAVWKSVQYVSRGAAATCAAGRLTDIGEVSVAVLEVVPADRADPVGRSAGWGRFGYR
jgi:hypothetical protein